MSEPAENVNLVTFTTSDYTQTLKLTPQHHNPFYNPCYAPDMKNNVPVGGPVPYKPNHSDKQTK